MEYKAARRARILEMLDDPAHADPVGGNPITRRLLEARLWRVFLTGEQLVLGPPAAEGYPPGLTRGGPLEKKLGLGDAELPLCSDPENPDEAFYYSPSRDVLFQLQHDAHGTRFRLLRYTPDGLLRDDNATALEVFELCYPLVAVLEFNSWYAHCLQHF